MPGRLRMSTSVLFLTGVCPVSRFLGWVLCVVDLVDIVDIVDCFFTSH